MSRHSLSIAVAAALITYGLALLMSVRAASGQQPAHISGTAPHDDAAAAAAFESIIPVLHHPRCMNCHSGGDFPRQGNESHRHTMNVHRGPDGDGIAGVKCSTCHQDHNLSLPHTPPGAPDWHLPSPAMPMIWEGLSDRKLCELLKDPAQNGGRNVDEVMEHMQSPLVLWGWHPGNGRKPVPISHSEFMARVKEWASKGAACPASK